MNLRISKFSAQIVSTLLAVSLLLPMGPMSCGQCQGCGTSAAASGATHCKAGTGCCGCCQKSGSRANCCANTAQTKSSCCEKQAASFSQTGASGCVCACDSAPPADRPVNSASTLKLGGEHSLLAVWIDLWIGASDGQQRLEIASSPSALAPDVPHRILHCSWLN